MTLGQRIKAARTKARLSQTFVADALGLTRNAVSLWESDTTSPSMDHLLKLPALLNVEFQELVPAQNAAEDIQSVPLVSWVRAGQLDESPLVEDLAEARRLRVAGLGPGRWIALKLEGTSMDRIVPPGATIIANLADRQLVAGKNYVVRNDDGASFKQYRARPERFEPMSSDLSHEPIYPDESLKVVARVKLAIVEL